jgi:hypothetical protein
MHAKEYAVVGKILTDTERFDYKVSCFLTVKRG